MSTGTANEKVLDGRFRIRRKVSRGAQGTVYEALDEETNSTVAIKYVSAKAPGFDEAARRLVLEHEALAKLSSVRDVVGTLGYFAKPHGSYLVLEWVEAPDAAVLLQSKGPLDVETWSWVARSVLAALAEAHIRHVVHCDVKPHNLLVGGQTFRLIDFGIAESAAYVSLDPKGEVQGTLPYLPPERALGMPALPASDVFSAGVTLFELLTGKQPFPGDTPGEVQRRKMSGEFLKVTALNPDAPAWLNDWFAGVLAPQPEQRPKGAREALALFDAQAKAVPDALPSLLRACARCGAELWRPIPFCTHCGEPYAVRPASGDCSVIAWKAENKEALAARYEALTGHKLTVYRRGLFLSEYPRILLHRVDEVTAQIAAAAFADDATSLTVSRRPYEELARHLRLSSVQQWAALAAVVSLLLFFVLYVSTIGRSGSARMSFELFMLLAVALGAVAYVAVTAAQPLIPPEHLVAEENKPLAKPLANVRAQLHGLTTPGARAKASRLVRRVQELHDHVGRVSLARELKAEFLARLGGALQHALAALRQSEAQTKALQGLRSQGARKQLASLVELARSERDPEALAKLAERIEALKKAELALAGAEHAVARAETDYANVYSGVNELFLLTRSGGEDSVRRSVASLPGESRPVESQSEV